MTVGENNVEHQHHEFVSVTAAFAQQRAVYHPLIDDILHALFHIVYIHKATKKSFSTVHKPYKTQAPLLQTSIKNTIYNVVELDGAYGKLAGYTK